MTTPLNRQLTSQQVILKVVDRKQEGWLVMRLEDFLKELDLDAWSAEQELIGIVLPPSRPRTTH